MGWEYVSYDGNRCDLGESLGQHTVDVIQWWKKDLVKRENEDRKNRIDSKNILDIYEFLSRRQEELHG